MHPKTVVIILDQAFKISVDKTKRLKFEQLKSAVLPGGENLEQVQICSKQTLRIETYVFCFEERGYFLLSEVGRPETDRTSVYQRISDLFRTVNVAYEETQKLQIIFDYQADKFVFVTEQDLFIIGYEQVKLVKKEHSISLSIVDTSKLKVIKAKHYLFNKIDLNKNDTETGNVNVTTVGPEKSDTKIEWAFLIIITIATTFLILNLLYRKFRIRLTGRPKTGLNSSMMGKDDTSLKDLKNSSSVLTSSKNLPSLNFNKLMKMDKSNSRQSIRSKTDGSLSYDKEMEMSKTNAINLTKFTGKLDKAEKSDSSKITYLNSNDSKAIDSLSSSKFQVPKTLPTKQS